MAGIDQQVTFLTSLTVPAFLLEKGVIQWMLEQSRMEGNCYFSGILAKTLLVLQEKI